MARTLKNVIGLWMVYVGAALVVYGMDLIDRLDVRQKLMNALEDGGVHFDPEKIKK